ncbi:serine hydrolase domain-containing protein [Listeria aquatica]|uniref:serine hydrolase domain-containing protein n=1 Tax=Listeria aquatica TaxID=1494960 RepID=UPI003F71EBAD
MFTLERNRKNQRRREKKKLRRKIFLFVLTLVVFLAVLFLVVQLLTPKSADKAAQEEKSIRKAKSPVSKQKEKKKTEAETKEVVQNKALDQYLTQLHFSGTAVVVRNGKMVLNKGYGYRNKEQQEKNTPDTEFYIGSSQKALTATAILQLVEKGKLSLTDPVSQYLSGFPSGITIKNLLNHTSGLKGHLETNSKITPKELVQDIEERGVKRAPGKWDYRDSNYTVLAYLVEKLSGQSLADYYKQHIFKPAGMTQVGFYEDFKQQKNASIGYYLKKDGSYSIPSMPDLSQLFGVGNVYMSAGDMYRFDEALMSGKLLSPESLAEMFTKGSSSGYGMGFYADPGSYNNHGVLNGWNVSNSISKSGKTFVILFSNIQNNITSFGKVNNEIYQILNRTN